MDGRWLRSKRSRKAGGGLSHQALASIINKRHSELLNMRSPVHRRSRKNWRVNSIKLLLGQKQRLPHESTHYRTDEAKTGRAGGGTRAIRPAENGNG
jgi:hypothetical protein